MADADLVLEGGGVKGIGLVGAISVLEERYRFHRVAGTSAGAIVGALVAGGISGAKMLEVMNDLDYEKFKDESFLDRFSLAGKGLSLLFEKGIYEGKYLKSWLAERLNPLGVTTFADLRLDDPGSSLPADRSYKLVAMTSDISRGRLVRLPWDYQAYGLTAGAQPVVDAVRMSMSIPFFYEAVQMGGSWFVDGGMLSNFPVEVFDRTDGKPPRWPTFGIKLSARRQANQVEHDVEGIISLTEAMIGTMTNFHDQMHLDDPDVLARTIFVDTEQVKATDFDIDKETQQTLYENGRKAATNFLKTWDFDAYRAARRG